MSEHPILPSSLVWEKHTRNDGSDLWELSVELGERPTLEYSDEATDGKPWFATYDDWDHGERFATREEAEAWGIKQAVEHHRDFIKDLQAEIARLGGLNMSENLKEFATKPAAEDRLAEMVEAYCKGLGTDDPSLPALRSMMHEGMRPVLALFYAEGADEIRNAAYYRGRDAERKSNRNKNDRHFDALTDLAQMWRARAKAAEGELRAQRKAARAHPTEQSESPCPPERHGGTGPGLRCTTCGLTDDEAYEHAGPEVSKEYAERMGLHVFQSESPHDDPEMSAALFLQSKGYGVIPPAMLAEQPEGASPRPLSEVVKFADGSWVCDHNVMQAPGKKACRCEQKEQAKVEVTDAMVERAAKLFRLSKGATRTRLEAALNG
jgi:hypothetical protein